MGEELAAMEARNVAVHDGLEEAARSRDARGRRAGEPQDLAAAHLRGRHLAPGALKRIVPPGRQACGGGRL